MPIKGPEKPAPDERIHMSAYTIDTLSVLATIKILLVRNDRSPAGFSGTTDSEIISEFVKNFFGQ
jgi:hypothetical protein